MKMICFHDNFCNKIKKKKVENDPFCPLDGWIVMNHTSTVKFCLFPKPDGQGADIGSITYNKVLFNCQFYAETSFAWPQGNYWSRSVQIIILFVDIIFFEYLVSVYTIENSVFPRDHDTKRMSRVDDKTKTTSNMNKTSITSKLKTT